MTSSLDRSDSAGARSWAGIAHSLLRVMAAAIFMQHGAQKLLGAFADPGRHGPAGHLPPLLLLAGVIELGGGTLILIGFYTRVVAFIAAGEMAVAYFLVHLPRGFWPIQNKGELPILLCFIFFYLAATGGGPYSIDAVLSVRRPAGGGA